jgi:hypothetical protein
MIQTDPEDLERIRKITDHELREIWSRRRPHVRPWEEPRQPESRLPDPTG